MRKRLGFLLIIISLSICHGDNPTEFPSPQWALPGYVKASNSGDHDELGWSIAVSETTIVVGSRNESSGTNNINGDQNNNSANMSGAVYVYIIQDGKWLQQAYLKPSNGEEYDSFGHSVSLSDDTIVAGAIRECSNGDQGDNSILESGAAYVFTRLNGNWHQEAYLKASNCKEEYAQFGQSVSISGDTIVVGSSKNIYVFIRHNGIWSQQTILRPSNATIKEGWGNAVSISGDTIVVGVTNEYSNAKGINGNPNDNSEGMSGAAYVFTRKDGEWKQEAYIKASNARANSLFGNSVSISGDTIVIGSLLESSNAKGINGNPTDTSAQGAGAAYVFTRKDGEWKQEAYIKASNSEPEDAFGFATSVFNNTIVVSAIWEDSKATGVDGDTSNNDAIDAGAVYVYQRGVAVP
ncbi:MAG: hypothetical protein ABIF71_12070 [Planctomycetota bacterium]